MNFFGRCAVVLAVMLALPMTLTAQIKVTHGPWLTDMSDTGVTIMWKTDKPAMAWVEYDEKTGDTFYSESHPKVYDTQDGRRRTLDTLHCVRLEGLKPGTEYFFGIMLMYNDQWHFAYATATLDEEPDTSNPEAEYLAFLGNWTVTGHSSKDYKTPLTYNLRIEQSVVNDSYKVYGWSAESFGETLPFIAKYNKTTKKMDIYGNQFISDVETSEGNAQLRFMGVLQYAGQNYLSDYDKVIYSATVRDNGTQEILGMSPAFFEVDKKWYEVQTMAYGFTDSTGKILGGADEFDMVEFSIARDKK